MSSLSQPRPGTSVARVMPLRRRLSEVEFGLFRQVGKICMFATGASIHAEGQPFDAMYLVARGEVRLRFPEPLQDRVLGPREFFGELALFLGAQPHVAGAVAESQCVLYRIDAAAFEQLVEAAPGLLAQFMRRSLSRLVQSEQLLVESLRRRNEDLERTLDSLRQTRTELGVAQHLIRTDDLTGLCNRRGLYGYLERLADMRLPGTVLGLLLLDVDRFKSINDEYGHPVGDGILEGIAAEVQAATTVHDLPLRLGGDEFALLLQVADAAELRERAERLQRAVRALRWRNWPGVVTVSIGGSICDERETWAHWYSAADAALYVVKERGRDGCEIHPLPGTRLAASA